MSLIDEVKKIPHPPKSIADLVNSGMNVKVYNQIKRMGDAPNKYFENRICWSVVINGEKIESKWEGFETADEAILDMIMEVNKKRNEYGGDKR